MTPPPYNGPERRERSAFEREVLQFMARIDQRNIDRDIQTAAREEAYEAHEIRITSLEETRTHCTGIVKTVAIGAPAIGSVAWFLLEWIKSVKSLKGGG